MLKLKSESRDGFFAFRRIGSSRVLSGSTGGYINEQMFCLFADLQDGPGNEGGNEKKEKATPIRVPIAKWLKQGPETGNLVGCDRYCFGKCAAVSGDRLVVQSHGTSQVVTPSFFGDHCKHWVARPAASCAARVTTQFRSTLPPSNEESLDQANTHRRINVGIIKARVQNPSKKSTWFSGHGVVLFFDGISILWHFSRRGIASGTLLCCTPKVSGSG